jgi:hypothetical protein
MATFKSSLVTKQEAARTKPSAGLRDGDEAFGILMLATASVVITGIAANDIIEIIPPELVPVGAVVVPQLCSVMSNDPGTTLTLDIGDAVDPDRYGDGLNLNAGGLVNFCSALPTPDGVHNPFRLTEQAVIQALVVAANAITGGTILTFIIAYRAKA